MPLPQLNTNIDYSNSLYKLVEAEERRRNQADIIQNRKAQTESLGEIRDAQKEHYASLNAMSEYNKNKETKKAQREFFDQAIKNTSLIDYSQGVEDHNKFRAWVATESPGFEKFIPILDPAKDGDLEKGKVWQKNSIKLNEKLRDGYKPEKTYIKNKDGEIRMVWAVPGTPLELEKGWSLTSLNAEDAKKEHKPHYMSVKDENGKTVYRDANKEDLTGMEPGEKEKPVAPKDYIKIGTDILLNADKPEVMSEMTDDYNENSPGLSIMIPKETVIKEGKLWFDDATAPKMTKTTLPKIDGVQVTKEKLKAFATANNVTYQEALSKILVLAEKKNKAKTGVKK